MKPDPMPPMSRKPFDLCLPLARYPLAVSLLLAACGTPTEPRTDPITALPRNLTGAEQAIIGDANAFGIALLAEMAGRDERPNVVLSPLSASMALGMTMNGAAGETFQAMSTTLGFEGLSQAEINDAYRGLIELLTGLDRDVRFDIANAIWANEGIPFHQTFFDAVADAFDARTESSDFADPATLEAINGWASEKTDRLIPKILDQLDPDLVMILLNAIYFDGAWTTQFDPDDTSRQAFTREDGSTVQVDMMSLADVDLPLGGGPDYTAAELPYGGGAFSMVVVVPNGSTSVRDFVARMDSDAWDAVIAGLTERELDLLSIPKFEITYDAFLNEALKAMGMEIAFGGGADFSNMSPLGQDLCIDFVRQKTFVEVDERGTRAAAVTAVGVGPVSFTGLTADRPFVFAIRERLTGTIVFIGMVGDPRYEDPGADPYEGACH